MLATAHKARIPIPILIWREIGVRDDLSVEATLDLPAVVG